MTRELLQQAIDALEDMNNGWKYIRSSHGDLYGVGWDRAQGKADDAIAALRQALVAPQPEQVALDERDALRRALEIIAVGDAQNPQAQAAEELIALGYWRDIPEARSAAPIDGLGGNPDSVFDAPVAPDPAVPDTSLKGFIDSVAADRREAALSAAPVVPDSADQLCDYLAAQSRAPVVPAKRPPHEWGGDYPSDDSYQDGYTEGWNDCIDAVNVIKGGGK